MVYLVLSIVSYHIIAIFDRREDSSAQVKWNSDSCRYGLLSIVDCLLFQFSELVREGEREGLCFCKKTQKKKKHRLLARSLIPRLHGSLARGYSTTP